MQKALKFDSLDIYIYVSRKAVAGSRKMFAGVVVWESKAGRREERGHEKAGRERKAW